MFTYKNIINEKIDLEDKFDKFTNIMEMMFIILSNLIKRK